MKTVLFIAMLLFSTEGLYAQTNGAAASKKPAGKHSTKSKVAHKQSTKDATEKANKKASNTATSGSGKKDS